MENMPADLARISLADRPLGDVLGDIVMVAVREVPGADSASITLLRGDRAFTAAYSSAMALHADEMQYERGYGPCIDAGTGGVVLRIDDMRTEQRWPDYAAEAAGHGVLSILSMPLPYQGSVIGALDAYSGRPGAFATPESLDVARTVAQVIAVTVANANDRPTSSRRQPTCAWPWGPAQSSSRRRAS